MLQTVGIINYLDLKLGIKNINYKINLSLIVISKTTKQHTELPSKLTIGDKQFISA